MRPLRTTMLLSTNSMGRTFMRENSLDIYYRQISFEYQRILHVATEYHREHVYRIECKDCNIVLCDRGMHVNRASNGKTVELYSTDLFPSTIGFIYGDYPTTFCRCRVRDFACTNCGNVVGYHVNMPCKSCQSQPNSGHSWMFRNSAIKAQIIYLKLGLNAIELPLLWGFVRETSGDFKTGDEEAARLSSQLSVHLSSFVYFFVHEPWPKRIFAVTYNDSNTHDEFILYSR